MSVLGSVRDTETKAQKCVYRMPSQSDAGVTGAGSSIGELYLEIEGNGRTIRLGDAEVYLTRAEFALLGYMAERTTRWVSAPELLQQALGYGCHCDSALVRNHVRSLRRKLGDLAWVIESRRTLGYRICVSCSFNAVSG
jgi:DNA-binding response OmpR family regulator